MHAITAPPQQFGAWVQNGPFCRATDAGKAYWYYTSTPSMIRLNAQIIYNAGPGEVLFSFAQNLWILCRSPSLL